MRTYSKSENTAELHTKISPIFLKRLKQDALDKEVSLGELVRKILEDFYTK